MNTNQLAKANPADIAANNRPPLAFNDLNHTDFEDLHDHEDLLFPEQVGYMELVSRRLQHLRERDHEAYQGNAAVLIATKSPMAPRYCYCWRRSRYNKSGRCDLWPVCYRCALYRQNLYLRRYLPSFHRGHWRFVTISFKGTIEFTSNNTDAVVPYWNAGSRAIRNLVNKGEIDGAFWVEEIAVINFLPLRVQPHAHAIVDSELSIARLTALFRKASRIRRSPRPPSIDVQELGTAKQLGHQIQYLVKPINLYGRYREVFDNFGRRNARELNNELYDFVHGFPEAAKGRRKIDSRGTLDPRSPRFIGIKENRLSRQREVVERIMAPTPR